MTKIKIFMSTGLFLSVLTFLIVPVWNAEAAVPSGFSETSFVSGFSAPTAMIFAPDGRIFVTEKGGKLRIVKNGVLLSASFLSVNVDPQGERGLLGIALDPNFSSNGYVYVYYTATSPAVHNRVSRFTANGDIALAGSEVILLELNNLSSATNHNGGAIHFSPTDLGTDGKPKLYIAVGDNANGSNSQTLGNLHGKILRMNSDGTIPTDNPFYSTASGQNRLIWATGLRNPFTMAFDPSAGELHINDVGQNTWEEINRGIKGANYGWPTCEGLQNTGVGTCTSSSFTYPVYAYDHSVGQSITGGVFYRGSQFPSQYSGVYFFGDYVANFIKYLNTQDQVSNFGTSIPAPVDMRIGPDGSLYYLSISSGRIYKIQYGTDTPPPVTCSSVGSGVFSGCYYDNIDFTGLKVTRNDPVLNFDWTSGSPDPLIAEDTFSVKWEGDFNFSTAGIYRFTATADDGIRVYVDGALKIDEWFDQSATTYTADVSLTQGTHRVRVEYYENGGGATAQLSWALQTTTPPPPPNTAPVSSVTSPVSGQLYGAGDTVNYSGSGSDAEDGLLSANAFSWIIVFHHDTHTHPFLGPVAGVKSGSFVIPVLGETSSGVWYRIHLTVTDSGGLTHSSYKDILPKTTVLSFASDPSGLKIDLDGQPFSTPFTVTGVVGMQRTLNVLSTQTLNSKEYTFKNWSDGGSKSHTISTPASTTTYTAFFTETPVLLGDINGDRIVNSLDWSLMSIKWLTSDTPADLNKDGIVNSLDWSIMSGNWLATL